MKTFEFKQNDLKRSVPFAIIYFVLVIVACYLKFRGLYSMANALANFGSAKLAAIVGALAILRLYSDECLRKRWKMSVKLFGI